MAASSGARLLFGNSARRWLGDFTKLLPKVLWHPVHQRIIRHGDRVKTLFYSGDWRRVTRGGAFCAFWPGKPPVVTQAASMSAVPARFGPHMAALSRPDSRHQGLDAEDVERSPQIVDERRQAELGPDVVESLHQKCALVHPLLDRAEGMFDGLAAPVEDFRPRPQAGGHAVEHRLVLQTRDLTIAVGAARPDRTTQACRPVGVVDLLQIPELAFIAR